MKRHDQRYPALVVEMAGARFRHRPEAPPAIEGYALDPGWRLVMPLDLPGRRIDPVERAPAQVATCDPQPPCPVDRRALRVARDRQCGGGILRIQRRALGHGVERHGRETVDPSRPVLLVAAEPD